MLECLLWILSMIRCVMPWRLCSSSYRSLPLLLSAAADSPPAPAYNASVPSSLQFSLIHWYISRRALQLGGPHQPSRFAKSSTMGAPPHTLHHARLIARSDRARLIKKPHLPAVPRLLIPVAFVIALIDQCPARRWAQYPLLNDDNIFSRGASSSSRRSRCGPNRYDPHSPFRSALSATRTGRSRIL